MPSPWQEACDEMTAIRRIFAEDDVRVASRLREQEGVLAEIESDPRAYVRPTLAQQRQVVWRLTRLLELRAEIAALRAAMEQEVRDEFGPVVPREGVT